MRTPAFILAKSGRAVTDTLQRISSDYLTYKVKDSGYGKYDIGLHPYYLRPEFSS